MRYLIPKSYKLLLFLCCCLPLTAQIYQARVQSSGKIIKTRGAPSIPPPPVDQLLFISTGDDTGNTSAWNNPAGVSVTSDGCMELDKEITKTTAADSVMLDNQNLDKFCIGFDDLRKGTGQPGVTADRIFVAEDTNGTPIVTIRRETDWDLFAKIPGMTQFGGRGFFLNTGGVPLAADKSQYIELCYTRGTGSNAILSARVDGINEQIFTTGTSTLPIKKLLFRDENTNATQDWHRDRIEIRTLNYPGRPPITDNTCTPTPPPPPTGTLLTSYGATVCDGSTNAAPIILTALQDNANWINRTLVFPQNAICNMATKVLYSTASNGMVIEFNGSTLRAANGLCNDTATCTPTGALFEIRSANNITFNNGKIDGNRINRALSIGYNDSSGDNWRCTSCTNLIGNNMESFNAPSDPLRVGALINTDINSYPKNWTFSNSKFYGGGRNNVSVIQGWNIKFLGTCTPGAGGNMFNGTCTCQFTNLHADPPQDPNVRGPSAGIDLEPNSGDASPAVWDNEISGCLLADNEGSGFTAGNGVGMSNVWIHGNIFRNNGSATPQTNQIGGGAIRISVPGHLVEGNWIGVQAGARFGVIDHPFTGCSGTPPAGFNLSAGRCSIVRNNFIDGVPPVAFAIGVRRLLHYGNFGNPLLSLWHLNTLTNIGVPANGDWCGGTGTNNIINNTVDGVLQVPNPGCS